MNEDRAGALLAENDATIWRYMDLQRFIYSISTRQLRFARAETFKDDPWEGFCDVKRIDFPMELLNTSPAHQIYATCLDYSSAEFLRAPQSLYVNSWCLSRESMSMWDLYGARGAGVAITSTPARFRRAAKFSVREEQYAFGRVRYHENLETADAIRRDLTAHAPQSGALWRSVLALAFQKRCAFEAENEWRAALYQPPEQVSAGVEVDFDLDELIAEVFVGPRAEPSVGTVVREMSKRHGLRKPVNSSSLLTGPPRPGLG